MPASGRGNSLKLDLEASEVRYRHKTQPMEPTITQNGALFSVQHRPAKRNRRTGFYMRGRLQDNTATKQVRTLKRWDKGEQRA